MTMNEGWVLLRSYASSIEASLDLASLEAEGVPTLVKGQEPGIFGPGFSGLTPHGIRVYVPAAAIDDARDLIEADPTPDEF
jgi:hypothetical protein